nr:4,5-DOPA dioxygenase extradiol [Deltaproteobacteria bacterium]
FQRMQSGNTETPPWAARFDQTVAQALTQRDTEALLGLWPSEDGALAHPSPDHWWPLLYAYGATEGTDTTRFPLEGFDLGSLSMRNVIIG